MNHIFKRVEKKYILTQTQYEELLRIIYLYMEDDFYSHYTIHNIYYDSDDDFLIRTSIEKPKYKEKLRVRKYSNCDQLFVEIKKKVNGVVYKRRIIIDDDSIEDELYKADTQIKREIIYLIEHYRLSPHYYIAYDREAYKEKGESDLRLTIDSGIRSRKHELSLEDKKDQLLFDEPHYVLEIKTSTAYPLWLVHFLNEHEIYPTSFSKYGRIYKQYIGGNQYV